MKQSSFSDLAYEHKKKTTRKERFLGEMDAILPWQELLKPILKKYPKAGQGRQPIPAAVMLRIYFLEQHRLTEQLFRLTRRYLSERGLLLSAGTIVDASIISAPSSTKNRDRQRDPEMKQTKKGNAWYFGMKAHIGSDTQGRVHSVAVTHAAVHDSTVMADCLHGKEGVIYGDKAYADEGRRQAALARGVDWRVNRKARRGKRLNCADKSFNRKSNRTRSRVEHAFGVIKHLWGYRKVRYRGLEKNAAQMFTLFALANFYLARRELAVT